MNRRGFIAKALAGIAAIPFVGNLEFLLPAAAIAPQPTILTALIPTLHKAVDVVSRERIGFIPCAWQAYQLGKGGPEIIATIEPKRPASGSSSDTTV